MDGSIAKNASFHPVCAGESQAGNPIGSAPVEITRNVVTDNSVSSIVGGFGCIF